MRHLIAVIKQGPEVLEKEANKWWGGIAHMESKLGYPPSELEKLFWLDTEFSSEMEQKDLETYKREEVEMAIVCSGELFPEKIMSYKSGKRFFITKDDYEKLVKLRS